MDKTILQLEVKSNGNSKKYNIETIQDKTVYIK